ncbi:UNVERIFIED_CONTAM: hypothetical protein FKN15_021714 [Acipenser sinensis]
MACRVVSRVLSCRFASSSSASHLSSVELQRLRNDLFTREKARQQSLTPRIEKIEVKLVGKAHPGTLFVMNKGLSTPYSCARHLSEWHSKNSILALVNGEVWDMHCLLTSSCEIQFLTFKDEHPEEVNKAYWRSCAMLMGQVLESAFKEEFSVELLQSPEVPEWEANHALSYCWTEFLSTPCCIARQEQNSVVKLKMGSFHYSD